MVSGIPPGVDLCLIPSAPPPPGLVSNFVNPASLAAPTFAVGSILTFFCVVVFGGRLYSNRNKLKISDYFAIIAFILTTSYTGVVFSLYFLAHHGWDIPACVYADDYTWKLLFGSNILLGPTQFAVKVSILIVYFEIFAVAKTTRYMIWVGIALCSIIYLPHFVLVALFNAPRIGQKWSGLATNGMPQKLEFYAPIHGIGSIVIDIWIFIIPIFVLSKLRVKKKKKVQLVGVFLIAFLAIVSSAVSCYWRLIITFRGGDVTWDESQLFIWIIIEQNLAIIVGSMPAFAAFVKISIVNSTVLSSLRTQFLGQSIKTDPLTLPTLETIGQKRGSARKRPYYYELDDTLLDNRTTEVTTTLNPESVSHTSQDTELGTVKVTTSFTQGFQSVDARDAQ
ncbi:hypothetical protein F4678DRAFT_476821 [Xylaria arbuscula]|nr:hypothetical protein F4678DRAFT_476821 [Xylaria arbuscula]